jgi:hypothetical protein
MYKDLSVVDPNWFQCGSGYGSSIFWQCRSGYGPRPKVLMNKNWVKFYSWNFYCVFFIKNCNFTYPSASIKDVQASGKVFIPQKRTFSTSKLNFLHYCWSFWPSWIRILIPILNADPADPDTQHWKTYVYYLALKDSGRRAETWFYAGSGSQNLTRNSFLYSDHNRYHLMLPMALKTSPIQTDRAASMVASTRRWPTGKTKKRNLVKYYL